MINIQIKLVFYDGAQKSLQTFIYLSFTPLKVRIHWGIGLDCWHFDSKVGCRSAVCGRDYGGPWNKDLLKLII